jgi:hypothetical protein
MRIIGINKTNSTKGKGGKINKMILEYPKKIAWWHGTDALKLVMYPPTNNKLWHFRIFLHRIFWHIMHRFFDYHYVYNSNLAEALKEFGIKNIEIKELPYKKIRCDRKEHNVFTVLFYIPIDKKNQKFKNWIYGKEYFEILKKHFNVLLIDGTYDMSLVFPVIDCFVKVNRTKYNSLNRIGHECLFNNIPVYELNNNIEECIKWINIRKDI